MGFLQRQCFMTWGKCGRSHFTHYTTYVATKYYKTLSFTNSENHIHECTLEPIPMSVIQAIAFVGLSSQSRQCETGYLLEVMRLVNHAHFALNKHFDTMFCIRSHSSMLCTNLKPNPCTNFSLKHNVQSPVQHSLAKFWILRIATYFHMYYVKILYFGLIGHIWPLKETLKYLSL